MYFHQPIRQMASAVCVMASLLTTAVHAGVVVNGTRIIFENNQIEKSVQLDNRDNFPNLVQMWTDRGNENLTIENADGPFLINPQIFKMNPNQSQIVRLNFIGQTEQLPKNQESLFYLNVNEIPALKAKDLAANRLVVSFTNRIKIFYRPKTLVGDSYNTPNQVKYRLDNHTVRFNNPTPYYANIAQIQLLQNSKVIQTQKSLLVPPHGHLDWQLNLPIASTKNTEIKAIFINDFGAAVPVSLNAE